MADMYEEEFQRYMSLSKKLLEKLKDKADVAICKRWIQKLTTLRSDDLMVKKNRNFFFKYLLHVMHDGILEGPFQELPLDNLHSIEDQVEKKCLCAGIQPGEEEEEFEPKFMMHWSKDGRTYVAAKPIPGCGALIYMAVAKDPSQGWDIPGKLQPINL